LSCIIQFIHVLVFLLSFSMATSLLGFNDLISLSDMIW